MSKTISAMKLVIVLLIFLLTGSMGTVQKAYAGSTTSDNIITASIDFPNLEINRKDTYDLIVMPGLDDYGEPGTPVLPYKTVKILLPHAEKPIDIKVTPKNKTILKGDYLIKPAQEFYPISYNGSVTITLPDADIYDSSNPYPGKLYSDALTQKLYGYDILMLNLYPVHYIPETGQVYYFQNMEVEIFTEPDKIATTVESIRKRNFRGLLKDRERVETIVDNPDTLQTYDTLKTTLDTLNSASIAANTEPLTFVNPTDSYDYIIITNTQLNASFQPLIDWKIQKGLKARIVLIEDIYSNYPENDYQTRIRNFIIDAYNDWGIEYILLGGDDDIIPHRGFYAQVGGYTDYDIPSDLYYAALDGTWDNDLDDVWGESGELDLYAEVCVGRAPVNNEAEVNNFINKIIAYENLSGTETYLKKTLMAGEKLDSSTWGGNYKDEIAAYITPPWTTSTLYDRDYPENDWPNSEIISRMNQGQHLINHMGHAYTLYSLKLDNSDIDSLTSSQHFLVYSQGCYPGAFDNRSTNPSYYYSQDSFCENLVKKNEHGAFAAICNSRYGWYSPGSTDGPSQYFDREFFDAIFNEDIRNVGRALQDSKEESAGLAASYSVMRWVYYELNLLGDPETSIHAPLSEPHDISLTHMEAPATTQLNSTVGINVTVNNEGQNDENNIEIRFLVNGSLEDSQIISTLNSGSSQKLNFTWSTGIEGTYNLTIYAVSVPGEVFTSNNMVKADIIVTTAEILLVDDDGGDSYETYYSNALDNSGYSHIIWDVSTQGSPSAIDLLTYKIVIWFTGDDYITTLTTTDQTNLETFLDSGGKLFISGQDIGYSIGSTNFYQDYLHANFENDDADIYNLNGVSGDPVTHNINISIAGGDGADNQGWPSEISPYDGSATPVFYYEGDGIGAIRADTGTYRMVYFAFGFEAINNTSDRAQLMDRIIKWLDIKPPDVYVTDYGATYVPAGSPVTINAIVDDVSDILSVFAKIESPDENIITTVQLFDDGTHNDGLAGDNVYGNSWTTGPEEKDYYIDFTATDIWENTADYNNTDRFTTVPFSATSDIVLAVGYPYSSYLIYYEDALKSFNYSYNVWDPDLRGEIDNTSLNSFIMCVWSSPFGAPDSGEQSVLSEFLDSGGRLFISGQDIGRSIGETKFYKVYLHANYIQDDANLFALNGTSGDPITNEINVGIAGGDGANNQLSPSEIDPIIPAVSIFYYNSTVSMSDYETAGMSGSGALRVDNGTFRAVYFAFGFEAINDEWIRAYLMNKIIKWLDMTPPSVNVAGEGVTYVPPGSSITINANVSDENGISSVFAEIESPDENGIATIQLFDDGSHNDSLADDGIYGNSWITDQEEKEYYIDFTATDNVGNIGSYDNLDMFTTIPFSITRDILLVDGSYYDSYIDYYEDALYSNGFSYDLWQSDLRGDVDSTTINSYKICIWSSPFSGPDSDEQSVLSEFLDNGGRLFVSGQDIGYSIGSTNFYEDYLHAIYIQDDANLNILNGISGDPLTDGIVIGIEGGANNQWWPSEIDAIVPAVSIFDYDTASVQSKEYQTLQKLPYEINEQVYKPLDNYGMGISSSGSGGLRVDNGTYRLIYFAFGFEGINSSDHRNTIMNRIVNWLDKTPPAVTGTNPENNAQNVKVGSSVTAAFGKLMNSSTLNNRTVKVYSLSDEMITGETFEDANGTWNSSNFQGFKLEEELTVWQRPINDADRTIEQHNLTYSTHVITKDFQVYLEKGIDVDGSGNYSAAGWLGHEHVIVNNKPNKLAKLVFEQEASETRTMHTKETWELGDGYSLTLTDIDISGDKAWFTLSNSNGIIEDMVISNHSVFYIKDSIADEPPVPFFVTYLNKVNLSNTDPDGNWTQLKYTWLISREATEINSGQSFGMFEVSLISSDTIELFNRENVSLIRGGMISLVDVLKFEVEDDPTVQYRLISKNKTEVKGDISYEEASRTVTFEPDSDLSYSTDYISYITTGAEDIGGNNVMEDYVWEFKTAAYISPYIPPETPSNSDSGGGGGGGGGTDEDNDNIECFEIDRQFVDKDSLIIYNFTTECNIVERIKFKSLTTSGTIVGKIEKLKNTSSLVDLPPPNIVYKNVNIWVGFQGWATSSTIAGTIIEFKVEKSWVMENAIDESTIALWRYNDAKWNKLTTWKTGENSDTLYFEAETPGFSPFAITGEKKTYGIGASMGRTFSSLVDSKSTPEPAVPQVAKTPSIWPAVLAILITVIAVGGAVYLKRDSINELINQRRR